jgi:hypothetical protein
LDRLVAGIVGSNPLRGMDVYVYVYVYSVFVLSCVGRGLARSWSHILGVLATVLDKETEVKRKVSWMPHAPVEAKNGIKKRRKHRITKTKVLYNISQQSVLLRGEDVSPKRKPKLEDHPVYSVIGCLLNIFAATVHIWRPSPPSAIRRRAVPLWRGTQLHN